ncbi:hypothetical protein EC968_005395 [Mortierella alpina]|nr:hypothetical protein EC968_005395 [Mortierella alpina]
MLPSRAKVWTYKTAEGIHSAFKLYFVDKFGCDAHNKVYKFENGQAIGNPVYDKLFVDYMESLRRRYGRTGGGNNSLPMLYKDLEVIMPHLQDPATKKDSGVGLCLYMQAFLACGFTLFTRTDELLSLKGYDLDLGLKTVTGSPYFTIRLSFRKMNQADPKKANVYEIHPQAHEPHACAYTKLLAWLDWLGKNARPLQADDLVFPAFATDGRVKLQQNVHPTYVLKVLDKFVRSSGLDNGHRGRFTTHCLRRGGAQHRFMFAKEKWTLKALKWWGGWSEGEQSTFHFHDSSEGDPVTKQSIALLQEFLKNDMKQSIALLKESMQNEISNLGLGLSQQIEGVLHAVASSSRVVSQAPPQVRPQVPPPQASLRVDPEAPSHTVAQVHVQATMVHPTQPVICAQAESSPKKRGRTARLLPQEGDPRKVADRIPDITSWKEATDQWCIGNHARGLKLPLRVWGPAMRKTDPARYSQRKQITMEYEFLNSSDENMREVHGAALGRIFTTLKSIRKHKKLRTNGHPMQVGQEVPDDSEDEEEDEDEADGVEQGHKGEGKEEDEDEEEEEPPLIRKRRKV